MEVDGLHCKILKGMHAIGTKALNVRGGATIVIDNAPHLYPVCFLNTPQAADRALNITVTRFGNNGHLRKQQAIKWCVKTRCGALDENYLLARANDIAL